VVAAGSDGLLPELVQVAAGRGLLDLKITEPSLETVFIQLTGRDLRE
jgi:ABC-2 type transport system ATP-binding protein